MFEEKKKSFVVLTIWDIRWVRVLYMHDRA